MPAVGRDDLRAAAADIDDQDALVALRPDALHAQVDQARFFAARDDFHRRAGGFRGARQELALIAGVADGAGGHDAHAHHVELAVEGGHARSTAQVALHGFFADGAAAEDALAQARDFAVGRQDARRLAGNHLRGFHADGVAADVDGGVAGHASILSGGV